MKIHKDFVLRQIAESWVVLPLAEKTVNFNGMLTLNESGVMLWRALEQGADREALVSVLTAEYTVSEDQAAADVDEFVQKLRNAGCLDEQ